VEWIRGGYADESTPLRPRRRGAAA
jgi:hypothetical protein